MTVLLERTFPKVPRSPSVRTSPCTLVHVPKICIRVSGSLKDERSHQRIEQKPALSHQIDMRRDVVGCSSTQPATPMQSIDKGADGICSVRFRHLRRYAAYETVNNIGLSINISPFAATRVTLMNCFTAIKEQKIAAYTCEDLSVKGK